MHYVAQGLTISQNLRSHCPLHCGRNEAPGLTKVKTCASLHHSVNMLQNCLSTPYSEVTTALERNLWLSQRLRLPFSSLAQVCGNTEFLLVKNHRGNSWGAKFDSPEAQCLTTYIYIYIHLSSASLWYMYIYVYATGATSTTVRS